MDDSSSVDPLKPKYKRVVLKISGEGFGHSGKSGISIDETLSIARQAQRVLQRGVQLAIVVGGGNILRGAQISEDGLSRPTADAMGMLATVMNGLVLEAAIERLFANPCAAYLHVHYAAPGCYAARVDRAA